MSQHSTRWPSSTKASPRLSGVVVFAAPPFWLANAIPLQVGVTEGSASVVDSCTPVFAGDDENPPRVCCPLMPDLLDRRLIFVTGKGGVGKSTVATVLGLLGARRGLRTIVVELSSQERMQRVFEHEAEH